MAISGQLMFEGKVDQYGMGASHAVFIKDYLRALRSVATSLANDLNEDAITFTDVNASLNYPMYAWEALEAGLDRWLVQFGHKTGDLSVDRAIQVFKDARAELRLHVELIEQRAAVAADTDQPGSGQVGLTA